MTNRTGAHTGSGQPAPSDAGDTIKVFSTPICACGSGSQCGEQAANCFVCLSHQVTRCICSVAPLCASAVASMFTPLGALPPSQLLMLQTLILCGIVTRTTLSSA